MRREDLTDLAAFMVVAEEKSFTRAAVKLATSQSALSHTMRRLETRLGTRLLERTTRSVAPTEAGTRLLGTLAPALQSIDDQVAALVDTEEGTSGTIRIAAPRHAARTTLWPAMAQLLPAHPGVNVELSIVSGSTGIVSDRFDADIGLGEAVAKDMVAVPISRDLRMAVVGSPEYFSDRPVPKTPADLSAHSCIGVRSRDDDGSRIWTLRKDGRDVSVHVEGQVAFDDEEMAVLAAEAGLGLAFVMEDQVANRIADGSLIRVLDDWCSPFGGYHLRHTSRRPPSAALTLLVDALRIRG